MARERPDDAAFGEFLVSMSVVWVKNYVVVVSVSSAFACEVLHALALMSLLRNIDWKAGRDVCFVSNFLRGLLLDSFGKVGSLPKDLLLGDFTMFLLAT